MDVTIQGPQSHRTSADSVELYEPRLGWEPYEFHKLSQSILVAIPHRPTEGIHASLTRNMGAWALHATPVATIGDQFTGFVELTRNGMVRTLKNTFSVSQAAGQILAHFNSLN